jgi:hypothetical protein
MKLIFFGSGLVFKNRGSRLFHTISREVADLETLNINKKVIAEFMSFGDDFFLFW